MSNENETCMQDKYLGPIGAVAGGRLADLGDQLKCCQVSPEEMAKREEEAKRQCDNKTAIMVLNFLEVGGVNQGTYLGQMPYGPFANELKEICIKKLAERAK